jgi:acyl transferase domain-containing protein/acyl carrier protein
MAGAGQCGGPGKDLSMSQATMRDPIAIVGIGCRFPGADGPDAFWQLLREGRDAISKTPPDRWDLASFYDADGALGRTDSCWGGYLDGVDYFDAGFFEISPREAVMVDPQQRLLLEVAVEAVEDAGIPGPALAEARGGVFVGVHWNDFEDLSIADPFHQDLYSIRGNNRGVLAGRVSYALGLRGPAVAVDAACASSLVAVHLAARSLSLGECDVALAAGVNVLLLPSYSIAFSQANMLARDGRCKAFDARADGFVRSDGVGVVVLKTLSRARADGDRVYAVIRGSAMNNDGRSSGAGGTPGVDGQEDLLRCAYADAGVPAGQVHYVEAHGTGTAVGDPVEAAALARVMVDGRPDGQPCMVGSVKSNIGHTEGASGVAGLIKVALALHHREIPASLHCETPTPAIPWADTPLRVQRETGAWPAGRPLLAGVSSFGIGGTNAHLVVEGVAGVPPAPATGLPGGDTALLTLSGRSAEAVRAAASRLESGLAALCETYSLAEVCQTAAVRRNHHDFRAALVGSSVEQIAARLATVAAGEIEPVRAASSAPPVIFIFPGQGGQWQGMAADLLAREPVFRAAVAEVDAAFRPWVDWSVTEVLRGGHGDIAEAPGDQIQPTLFAVQVALARLWRSWGVRPAGVVGHSMGEVAAAHVAGILSLADAARLICRRSQLMRLAAGRGAMAVLGLSLADTVDLLTRYTGRLSVAGSNGPTTTLISGDDDAVKELVDEMAGRDVFCRPVNVDLASHSTHMDPARAALRDELVDLSPVAGDTPFYSTVTATQLAGESLDADYWARNLREPVLFWPTVEELHAAGNRIFVEISPHPVLLSAIGSGIGDSDLQLLPSMRRDEGSEVLLDSLGKLHCLGCPVEWDQVYPGTGRPVPLPTYPWQRIRIDRAHADDVMSGRAGATRRGSSSAHPLLGDVSVSPVRTSTTVWDGSIDTRAAGYLADHRVQGAAVFPATGYVELALAAATALDPGPHELLDLSLNTALSLPAAGAVPTRVTLTPNEGELAFECYSDQSGDPGAKPEWASHARGRLAPAATSPAVDTDQPWSDEGYRREHCRETFDGAEFYRRVREIGLDYGPRFQGITQVWRADGYAWALLAVPPAVASCAQSYVVHPAILDACLQAALTTVLDGEPALHLPVHIGRVRVGGPIGDGCVAQARVDAGTGQIDVSVVDAAGKLVLAIDGVRLRRIEPAKPADDSPAGLRHEVRWTPVTRPRPATDRAGCYLVLERDGAIAGALQAGGHSCVQAVPGTRYRQLGADRFEVRPDSRDDLDQLLAQCGPLDGVLHAWTPSNGDESALPLICGSALVLVQALVDAAGKPPRLWLLTSGAMPVTPDDPPADVAAATLWGLGRTVANEHPELHCTLIDLAAGADPAVTVLAELDANDEDQIAWRGEQRHAARLVPVPVPAAPAIPTDTPFRLELDIPGSLDRIRPVPMDRRAPGAGEVEIEVDLAGLNFKDVMRAMGVLPSNGPLPLGIECAGRVVAAGDGVAGLRPGQRVLAVTTSAGGCLASHVIADARMVVVLPDDIAAAEAVTLPVAFLTAYYALHHVARIQPGDRVLVHSAAGGVGLAAVQFVQAAGAEVIATAGSAEKRAYLRDEWGIAEVLDSRSTDFGRQARAATGGRGVDIVLNSLSGPAIEAGLDALAPHGRFIELGKRDMLENSHLSLLPFDRALSYCAVDLEAVMRDRPDLIAQLLRELMDRLRQAAIRPLPARRFGAAAVADALRYLGQGRHIGKVLVSMTDLGHLPVYADGAYLITGGLGALGLRTARLLVDQGARYLVLLGRSDPTADAEAAIGQLRSVGAIVEIANADVANRDKIAELIAAFGRDAPPLRGIVHTAGLLADRTVTGLTWADFAAVYAPKVLGAWNLHRHTAAAPLDFFVLFSSVAALLGNPGQANYAAANCGLDALAHHRRQRGLPALSVNWGPWSDVGLAARPDRGGRLADRGLASIAPDDGVALLAEELLGDRVQVAVGGIDAPAWVTATPAAAGSSLLRQLLPGVTAEAAPAGEQRFDRTELLTLDRPGRRGLLIGYLSRQIARIARRDAGTVDVNDRVTTLGLDSLMAMELKQLLDAEVGASMPTVRLLRGPTVAEVADYILGQLPERATATPVPTVDATGAVEDGIVDQFSAMSDDELAAVLGVLLEEEGGATR